MSTAVHLAIYDGRDLMGSIVETDSGCKATDANGKKLGPFAARKEAIIAIYASWDVTRALCHG